MPATTPCPERPDLERLLLGLVSESEAEAWESHVTECPACSETVASLEIMDTLVGAVKHAPAAAARLPRGAIVDQLRQRLHAVHLLNEPTGVQVTAAVGDAGVQASQELTHELFHFLAPAQQSDELGRLGSYRVLKLIGQGGMGVVFLAEDTQLQRPAALKVVRPKLAATGSMKLTRYTACGTWILCRRQQFLRLIK